MKRGERIAFVKAGLAGYERLNDRSKARTSKAEWIALKLNCTTKQAERYIAEAEAEPAPVDAARAERDAAREAKAKDYSDAPMIANYPALDAWLQKVNGRCLFQEESSPDRRVEGWSINGALVVIILYAQKRGFHVLTEPNTISIEATFADAERRIATPGRNGAGCAIGDPQREFVISAVIAARVMARGSYVTKSDRDALAALSNEQLLAVWRTEVEGA